MSTPKKSVKKTDNLNSLIALCAKNNVKTLKTTEGGGVFVEFFPRSPEQLQQPFYQELKIDNTPKPIPAHLEKQYKELLEEDEKDMQILEDPSAYEENLFKELLGETNEE